MIFSHLKNWKKIEKWKKKNIIRILSILASFDITAEKQIGCYQRVEVLIFSILFDHALKKRDLKKYDLVWDEALLKWECKYFETPL